MESLGFHDVHWVPGGKDERKTESEMTQVSGRRYWVGSIIRNQDLESKFGMFFQLI